MSLEMTQKEKIELLKDTVEKLYCKEGRSKSYISDLLKVNRKELGIAINKWNFKKANISRLTPSNQKFVNKHKNFIISCFNNNISESEIAQKLNVGRDYLRNIIEKTDELKEAKIKYMSYYGSIAKERKEYYEFEDFEDEEWREIKYHPSYYVSDYGRIKRYIKRYKCYSLINPSPNIKNGRLYVKLGDKNLQVSRLVGFAFVKGYSDINNTIDHIDGDVTNNRADNLQWVSQSENNKNAYKKGRNIVRGYQKYGHFKKIILDNKYEFKTLVSLAKFLGISEVQLNRYIDKECKSDHKFTFIY